MFVVKSEPRRSFVPTKWSRRRSQRRDGTSHTAPSLHSKPKFHSLFIPGILLILHTATSDQPRHRGRRRVVLRLQRSSSVCETHRRDDRWDAVTLSDQETLMSECFLCNCDRIAQMFSELAAPAEQQADINLMTWDELNNSVCVCVWEREICRRRTGQDDLHHLWTE